MPSLLKALAHFRHAHHEILVFQIWDRGRARVSASRGGRNSNRWKSTAQKHLLEPALLREAYLANLAKFRDELTSGCRRHKIDLVPFTTDQPYAEALAVYLAPPGEPRMSFLNAALLGGMLALAIPIIIHLFHKSRFEVVSWGAMHLLETVIRTNQRKLRLEQWILLALRAAIPVILALVMARPVWSGAQSLLGEARTSTVVLLDNCYSMEAGKRRRLQLRPRAEEAAQDHRRAEARLGSAGGAHGRRRRAAARSSRPTICSARR